MLEDRLSQSGGDTRKRIISDLEPPDLGPLRPLAETGNSPTWWPGWPMPMAVRFSPMIRLCCWPATSPGR